MEMPSDREIRQLAPVIDPDRVWAVVCDIDGTLADCRHRRHHVDGSLGHQDFAAFERKDYLDPIVIPVANVLNAMRNVGYRIVFCSGRTETRAMSTLQWLAKWGFHQDVDFHALYMRPKNDNRDDAIVKRELLARMRADGFEPHFVLDDRDRVVAMWREAGIPCFQVAPGNF